MTPEMILTRNSVAAPSMDVWAIGIMMYSLLFKKLPFNGDTKDEIKKKITTEEPYLPRSIPVTAACKDFMQKCLQKDPDQRITVEGMLLHKWMNVHDIELNKMCDEAKE